MSDHFIDMLKPEPADLPPPPPVQLTVIEAIHNANREWPEVMKAARNGTASATSATLLFVSLSRFVHELIPDTQLAGRITQHFERQLRDKFPPPPGSLFS
jgi:hypothetical protein